MWLGEPVARHRVPREALARRRRAICQVKPVLCIYIGAGLERCRDLPSHYYIQIPLFALPCGRVAEQGS